jgi:transcription-repair coupling factor (superfamily II helicase)
MDRLICGDVGFGKTEVALRAAFITAHERQAGRGRRAHHLAGAPAFQDLRRALQGLAGESAPALPPGARQEATADAQGAGGGRCEIVVGTHALLAKTVKFSDLGLLVIDEEQRFGVKHKERLKELKSDVHVLTLTATPIPRTLQLAMAGIRDLSIIATPPVDRLAVRTYVTPFDRSPCARRCCANAIAAGRAISWPRALQIWRRSRNSCVNRS